MRVEVFDELYDALKEYLAAESIYSPNIYKSTPPEKPVYPIVILQESGNDYRVGTFGNGETHSSLSYSVDIYTQNITQDGITQNKVAIAREIAGKVDTFLSKIVGLRRISSSPTANVDLNIYRIFSRYAVNISDKTGQLY
jgi:hypothetical protein